VLANLPYVADDERLSVDVERYEPVGALRAGPDGLALIRRLLDQIAGLAPARRPPLVALEIGCGQAAVVSELVGRAGYGRVEVRRDLAGLDRVVVGRGDWDEIIRNA